MLTVNEAKKKRVCRICEEDFQTGGNFILNYGEWQHILVTVGKKLRNQDIVYTNGVKRAHKDCIDSTALRYNDNKPQTSYILHYPKVIELLARILEVGEVKYEKFNWKKGGNTDQSYIDAALRHMLKFINKDDPFDEEYGTHHLGHAIWNLMTLIELNGHEIMDEEKFTKALKELKDDKS